MLTTNKQFLLVFLILPSFSNAQVYINEIMYDLPGSDSGREWVEIFNAGSTPVDLSSFKFSEATTNHGIKSVSGSATLQPGEYGIIADDNNKFLIDWPSLASNLFDSSFSLTNTGATLTLKDGSGNVLDQIPYNSTQGAAGDGNTLQKTSSGWIVAAPTPGALNSNTPFVSATSTEDQGSTTPKTTGVQGSGGNAAGGVSSHYSPIALSNYEESAKFLVSAGRNRLGVMHSPLEFQAQASRDENSAIYTWSFGDGVTKVGRHVEHAYEYPGEYIVVLNGSLNGELSVDRTKVKINEVKISIKAASPEFIEIENKSKDEMNLYGWRLATLEKNFVFPKDTIIGGNSKLIFSSRITGLHPLYLPNVQITNTSTKPLPLITQESDEVDDAALENLLSQVSNLQKQIAALPPENLPAQPRITQVETRSVERVVANRTLSQVAAPVLAFASSSPTTTSSVRVHKSWWENLKMFLFNRPQ